MGDITISVGVTILLGIAGALVTLDKAWAILRKILHPESDLRETVKRHSEMLDNDNRRLQRVEHKLDDTDKFQGVMCRVMLAQLNHSLSGNDVSTLKTARDELNEYLTKR